MCNTIPRASADVILYANDMHMPESRARIQGLPVCNPATHKTLLQCLVYSITNWPVSWESGSSNALSCFQCVT